MKRGKEIWHCLCCEKKWEVTKKNAYRHMESHLPTHGCEKCGKIFRNREAFNRHSKTVHLSSTSSHSVSSSEVAKEIEAANKILERVAVADNMVVGVIEDMSYIDQLKMLTSSKMSKMMVQGSPQWFCLICCKSWAVKGMCKRHMQTHLVGCTLSCQTCDKAFKTSKALQWHRSKNQCGRKNPGEVKLDNVEEETDLGERVEVSRYERKKEGRIRGKQEMSNEGDGESRVM